LINRFRYSFSISSFSLEMNKGNAKIIIEINSANTADIADKNVSGI
jgi:hypothetical protein